MKARQFSLLSPLLTTGRARLVVSAALRTELWEVAARPKFRRDFEMQTLADVWRNLYAIKALETVVVESAHVGLCADPKDDFLLNLCLDARPDVLVSGDRLVREAAASAVFQPLRVWQLADLRTYAAEVP